MIDSHKYCGEGRAAIFGEPDFAYSMTRLCCENGVVPAAVATGSVCPGLKRDAGAGNPRLRGQRLRPGIRPFWTTATSTFWKSMRKTWASTSP
jgi:hypothetical protein